MAYKNLTALAGLVPLYRRRVTYLDTNALSDLSRLRKPASRIKGIEQVRRDLCSFASKRTIAVGQWLFSEMAFLEQARGRDEFLADMKFVAELQFLRVFRASGEMMRLEVEAFTRGLEPNPVISITLPETSDDREIWGEERRTLNEAKAQFAAWEADAEERTDEAYPDRTDRARRLAIDWDADKHGIVSRWVRGQMRSQREFLGLPRDEMRWPPLDKVPTLWCNWAFRITRDILLHTLPNPRKRRASDFVDWCHYMTAAHANEVVTTDKWFSRIAAECPGPKPEFLTLEEWIARLRREEAA